jgi:hypothetical protein
VARWRDDDDPVPERLARFVASEWPGADVQDRAQAWGAACRAWLAGRPGRVLPCAPDGSPVDVRREVIAIAEGASRRGWRNM